MDQKFEHNPLPYVLTWPFLWIFIQWIRIKKVFYGGRKIKTYSFIWDGIPSVKRMREGAARWPALDAIYNWRPTRRGLVGFMDSYYMHGRSCQALRNRYRLVVRTTANEIVASVRKHKEARILSLAAGTCQSVFEASKNNVGKVKILAVDTDKSAIVASKELARKNGVDAICWKLGDVLNPKNVIGGFKPTIVEVVGLFDYLDDKEIKDLIRRLTQIVAPGTVLISAHIHPNQESLVIKELLDWEMNYRTKKDFKSLILASGLVNCQFQTEPHGVFTVVRGEF